MNKLLVVGSIAFDTISTRAGKRQDILGGAATYISVCASNFTTVDLCGVAGMGDFDKKHIDLLTSKEIDLAGLKFEEGRTFRWSGVYSDDFSSRETLSTELGVFENFKPFLPDNYKEDKFVLLGNIHPSLQLEVFNQLNDEAFVAADTMNLWIDTACNELDKLVKKINLLIINDEESFMMTGQRQIKMAAAELLKRGPKTVIIKRGEHGAWLFTKNNIFYCPAIPLDDVIDPTGAGDTFAGGLMGYLASQGDTSFKTLKKAMLYGTAAASCTVQDFGLEKLIFIDKKSLDDKFQMIKKLVSLD